MSDLLERATRALRETTAAPQPRSGLTRARVLDSAEKRYAPRRGAGSLLRWTAVLFAAFAASTAFAHVVQYWPEIKRALAPQSFEPSRGAPSKQRKVTNESVQPAAAERPVQPAAVEPAVVTPREAPAAEPAAELPVAPAPARATSGRVQPKPAARTSKRVSPPALASESVAPAPSPTLEPPVVKLAPAPNTESAELALFRRAQRLHLNRDPRALAAWDDYLRVAGSGPLAPEARYNRALCLVRSGRKIDAKAALAPFANGAYGTYRRTEAAALIEALDAAE